MSIVSCHLNVGGSIGISAVMLVLSNGIIHQLDIQYRTTRAEGRGGDLASGDTAVGDQQNTCHLLETTSSGKSLNPSSNIQSM